MGGIGGALGGFELRQRLRDIGAGGVHLRMGLGRLEAGGVELRLGAVGGGRGGVILLRRDGFLADQDGVARLRRSRFLTAFACAPLIWRVGGIGGALGGADRLLLRVDRGPRRLHLGIVLRGLLLGLLRPGSGPAGPGSGPGCGSESPAAARPEVLACWAASSACALRMAASVACCW